MISKNKKFFESLHLKYPSKCIASIDDYLYFIAAWKIYRLKNCIKFLDQDKADFLQKLADEAEPVVCSSRMDDALKFTNDNASEICDPNQIGFGMMNAIADFVTRFQDKIKISVFECLCLYWPSLVVSRFDDLHKVFERNTGLFFKLFKSGHVQDIMPLGLANVLEIWSKAHKNEQYKQKVDSLIDEFCEDVESLPLEKSANILETLSFLKTVDSFLKEVKSPKANIFSEKVKKAENLAWEYYQGSGNSINIEIDILVFSIEKWKSESDVRSRMLSLTHRLVSVDDDKVYESFLSEKPVFSHSDDISQIGSDEFLNPFHQNNLLVWAFIETEKFYEILGDQKALADYSEMVKTEIKFISDGLESLDSDLESGAAFLFVILNDVSEIARLCSKNNGVSCYASLTWMCTLIERLLRLLYIHVYQNEQCIPDTITLGNLLDVNNTNMTVLLGKAHLLSLGYFLIKTSETKIGLNCRNDLAHWSPRMKLEQMNPYSTSELLWLFTDVLNTVFLYIEKEK